MKISNIVITSILLITLLFSTSSFAQPDYPQEINSSDILKQIENGEVVYISDSLIKGKLDLSSANLSKTEESGLKIVRSQITILNSYFEEAADFSNTTFESEIKFYNCTFGMADFNKSHFKQDVDFGQSTFGECNFSEVVFYKKADFRKIYSFISNFEKSIFNGRTFFGDSTLVWTNFHHVIFTNLSSFQYVTFRGPVDFRKSTFSKSTNFQHVDFDDYVDFTDSTFNGSTQFYVINFGSDAVFTNTTFNGLTKFISSNFDDYVDFTDSTFNGSTQFYSANFGSKVDFINTTFLDEVDFSKSVFIGDAYFDNAIFKKHADFRRVEFNNVIFTNTTFEEVSFLNADFLKMDVEWDNIKKSVTFNSPFYLKLRENFIKLNKYTDSDDVYYEYRKNTREDENLLIWFLDWAVSFICGYGVKPQNTIYTGFFVVFGFAGYYYCREHLVLIRRVLKKWQNRNISANIAKQNSILYLLDKLKNLKIWAYPAVSNFMSHLFKKNDKFDTKGFLIDCWDVFWFSIGVFIGSGYESSYSKERYPIATMLEKIIGSLIITLFVVTLTNVLIRI